MAPFIPPRSRITIDIDGVIEKCPESPNHYYFVTLGTPKGMYDVDLCTMQGPGAAARRAHISMVAAGYGDLDVVKVMAIRPCTAQEVAARRAGGC